MLHQEAEEDPGKRRGRRSCETWAPERGPRGSQSPGSHTLSLVHAPRGAAGPLSPPRPLQAVSWSLASVYSLELGNRLREVVGPELKRECQRAIREPSVRNNAGIWKMPQSRSAQPCGCSLSAGRGFLVKYTVQASTDHILQWKALLSYQ